MNPPPGCGILVGMETTEYKPRPLPQWVDLTGLPDDFVWTVKVLVAGARERYKTPAPDGADPRMFASRPNLTVEEFEKLLDEMAERGRNDPILPADWSRADIYDDHD
ncbi:MAG: hypothetical protein K2X87_11965 [Gemmataceae bacterium]|nr:hypothetical protein [Gemmataceae bacterium]